MLSIIAMPCREWGRWAATQVPAECDAFVKPEQLLVRGFERQHNTSIVDNGCSVLTPSVELGNQLLAQAPRWIFILLVLLISVRGALLIADLAGGPVTTATRSAQPVIQPLSRKVVDIPSILRANLFGQAPLASGADAPVTTMNLKLILVFADADEKRGWAALGPSLTEIKVYKVGDAVPGGANLHAVYVDRVLLDRSGNIEALVMPQRTGQTAVVPPMPMASNPAASVARVQQAVRDNPSLINQVMQRQRCSATVACAACASIPAPMHRLSRGWACGPTTSSRPSTAWRWMTRPAAARCSTRWAVPPRRM